MKLQKVLYQKNKKLPKKRYNQTRTKCPHDIGDSYNYHSKILHENKRDFVDDEDHSQLHYERKDTNTDCQVKQTKI